MTAKRRKPSRRSTRDSRRGDPRSARGTRSALQANKKSPAQLDREITEAISRHVERRSHATLAKGFALVPGFVVE